MTLIPALLCLLGVAASGCTFYTSCPTGAPGDGSMASSGGSGNNTGGSGSAIVDEAPPDGEWINVTPDLSGIENTCGPVFHISSHPDLDQLIAGIAGDGLWSTEDGGASWQTLGQGRGSAAVANSTSGINYDPADPQTFWESGIYGPGIFKTVDGGSSFRQLGDLAHLDSLSIDFSDTQRSTMLASAHEQQLVHKSVDGGETWDEVISGLPSYAKHCRFSLIVDSSTYLLSCGGWFDAGVPVTLRSTDAGMTWTEVHDNGGGAAPLVHSDGSFYWAEEFDGGLARSTDEGQTWTRVVEKTLSVQPVELPDGRIASLTADAVVVSADAGMTWKKVSPATPFKPVGFAYSSFQKAFFIFYFLCNAEPTAALGNEIMRFDYDYEK